MRKSHQYYEETIERQKEHIESLERQIRHLKFYIEELEAELDEGKNSVQEI